MALQGAALAASSRTVWRDRLAAVAPRLFGGVLGELAQPLAHFRLGQSAPWVLADGRKAIVERLRCGSAGREHFVEQPEQAVAVHAGAFGEAAQIRIAGQKRPAIPHGEGQGEAVRQRQCRHSLPVLHGLRHALAVQLGDLQAEFAQPAAAFRLQLPLYPGGSSIRWFRSATVMFSSSAALGSETTPSAKARRQSRSKRRGRSSR